MKKRTYTYDVSLVIPVYNEVDSLPTLHDKLTQVMTENGWTWEVIYVDDGSQDGGLPRSVATNDEVQAGAKGQREVGVRLEILEVDVKQGPVLHADQAAAHRVAR